jgi:choline dehydrogenase
LKEYDYIIVGAGSAGCVLANRLGADTSKSLLVIEAGPMDYDLLIHIPAGVYSAWRNPKLNWNFMSEAEEFLEGRSVFTPRGCVLGGSSSINSMVYMRGHPRDFDGWRDEHRLQGWGYADCLPYFKAGESYALGADRWRGDQGPLGVSPGNFDNPLFDAFVASGDQSGLGHTNDPNGEQPEGLARLDATRRNGRRCSAAVAHLRPALRRGNVELMTSSQVEKIIIENDRATGVVVRRKGKSARVSAGEVLLSGGAINSPQLLMLSGIGPADHLRAHEIAPVCDLPGVGQNLMDHPCLILQFSSKQGFPIQRVDRPWNKFAAGARWVFTRDGIAASNIWEAGGLIRSNADVDYANLHTHFAPIAFEYDGQKIRLSQGFGVHVDVCRPKSRGTVTLQSPNPQAKPNIRFNYLQEQSDMQQMVEGVMRTRDLVATSAFDDFRDVELEPGPSVRTKAEIAAWIRQNVATDFHPCGTCAMGHTQASVVDPSFRVKGIERLRVIDASVFPMIPSANLNAPTQMIAARAADLIAGNAQLEPINLTGPRRP